jgi:hypothetical protein
MPSPRACKLALADMLEVLPTHRPARVPLQLGMFVNRPAMVNASQPGQPIMDYWRGYLSTNALELLPPDGTVSCKDRLRTGEDCDDVQVRPVHPPRGCARHVENGTEQREAM